MMNPLFGYQLGGTGLLTVILIAIWVVFWKIASLWIAAKNNHKIWFIALAIINTMGILEIVYIFYIAKKKWPDVKEIFTNVKNQ